MKQIRVINYHPIQSIIIPPASSYEVGKDGVSYIDSVGGPELAEKCGVWYRIIDENNDVLIEINSRFVLKVIYAKRV